MCKMILQLKNWKIYIKKSIKSLVWFELYYLMFYGFFRDILKFPGIIAYVLDLINIILLIYIVFSKKCLKVPKGYYRIAFVSIIFFICITFVGLHIVGGSIVLYVWGFRNVFRFYLFFLVCALLLDIDDIKQIATVFKNIFIINFFVCLLELLMGYSGDFIGGIFGTQQGCNGYLNLFMVIITAIYVTEYLENKLNVMKISCFLLSTFFIMAISELKVFLFELPIIIFLALINAKFSFRKITIIMVGVIGVSLGISMLGYFFEDSGLSFFTSEAIYKYMGDSGYTNSGDLSRLNAVPQIYNKFLKGSLSNSLFGIGLGNAGYSSAFSFFNSRFFMIYNALHYHWFTDAYIYIELGIIGLIIFEGFFFMIFIFSKKILNYFTKKRKYIDKEVRIMVQVSGIISVLCIFLSIYNSSLSMDSAYMVYFFLAVPVIADNKLRKHFIEK